MTDPAVPGLAGRRTIDQVMPSVGAALGVDGLGPDGAGNNTAHPTPADPSVIIIQEKPTDR